MTNANNISHLKKLGKDTSTFYFKQFKVEDGRSTMKVGTDAVLLGAVADTGNDGNILEIGTGCGVIALMLAQRCRGRIDAIEIDKRSARQAEDNVMNSPWKDRIKIIHSSLQDYARQSAKKYDLVISNPPFFSRSLKSTQKIRNISRHNDSLSFDELIGGSACMMAPGASLWVILPVKESPDLIDKAGKSGLSVHFLLKIAAKQNGEFQRVIIQLKEKKQEMVIEKTLVIKNTDDSFTKDYMALLKEFYLDF